MKMDGWMKNEGLVLDRLQEETRRWRQLRDPERCPCAVFWALKDLAPTRRERARDMRAITRHVSSICIQEDLLSGARWGRLRGCGSGSELRNGGARDARHRFPPPFSEERN